MTRRGIRRGEGGYLSDVTGGDAGHIRTLSHVAEIKHSRPLKRKENIVQTLATYSFSIKLSDDKAAIELLKMVNLEVEKWLDSKGSNFHDLNSGDFRSKNPNGLGSITKDEVSSQSGSFLKICLEELSGETEIFSTTVHTAVASNEVFFHCSLQLEGLEAGITKSRAAPKCPLLVRQVASLSQDWSINGNEIPSPLTNADTEESGAGLAHEIYNPLRRIPILVVAKTEEDDELWPGTAKELSYDLFAIAKVFILSDEASYPLSEREPGASAIDCYDGAIRLYWPPSEGIVPSQLWTQRQLLSRDRDGRGRNRIRRDIKEILMSAASISNPIPSIIKKIATEAYENHMTHLENSGTNATLLEARVRSLENDNQQLTKQLEEARQKVFELSTKLKYQSTYQSIPNQEDDNSSNDSSYAQPQDGETRFYKKIADKGSHDLLRQCKDCGHNSWQNSASADKARKGLEKLEGRSDWKNMWHCGSCTGGGVWKVRW